MWKVEDGVIVFLFYWTKYVWNRNSTGVIWGHWDFRSEDLWIRWKTRPFSLTLSTLYSTRCVSSPLISFPLLFFPLFSFLYRQLNFSLLLSPLVSSPLPSSHLPGEGPRRSCVGHRAKKNRGFTSLCLSCMSGHKQGQWVLQRNTLPYLEPQSEEHWKKSQGIGSTVAPKGIC